MKKSAAAASSETDQEIAALRTLVAQSDEALRAIRSGEVDAVLVAGKQGNQVFSLEGSDHPYRVLIESMNEGALTLTFDKRILYANAAFARMVKCPLEQVIGGAFHRFLTPADRATLRGLLKKGIGAGFKIQLRLNATDGSHLPAQISIRPLGKKSRESPMLSMVVTDLTEARRSEEMLRALTHRVVQVQEAERGGLALELHDNVTQLLCGVLFRSQALTQSMVDGNSTGKREAAELQEMIGRAAKVVERISKDLRPGMLEQLGFVEVLGDTAKDFGERTRIAMTLKCAGLAERLPSDIELALYRILQEAFKNVERHARARRVTVSLTLKAGFVELMVKDDGVGFGVRGPATTSKRNGHLGLLGMRERAAFVGGTLKVTSVRHGGTEIKVQIPLAEEAAA